MSDDEERKEAERLAERYFGVKNHGYFGNRVFIDGYLAGRESMRAERDYWCEKYGRYVDKWNDSDNLRNQRDIELKIERARFKKLIEALLFYTKLTVVHKETSIDDPRCETARQAIAEYEGSRDGE